MTNRIKVKSLQLKGYILDTRATECLVELDSPYNNKGLVSRYLWVDYKDMVYMKSKAIIPPIFKHNEASATKVFLDAIDSTKSH